MKPCLLESEAEPGLILKEAAKIGLYYSSLTSTALEAPELHQPEVEEKNKTIKVEHADPNVSKSTCPRVLMI